MPDIPQIVIALTCFASGIFSAAAYSHFKHSRESQGRRSIYSHVVGQAGFRRRILSHRLLLEAYSQAKQQEIPKTGELAEAYFVTQVSIGELLATQGPEFHLAAAIAFFKAILIYPNQMDLVVLYQHHVPEPIFKARTLSDVILRVTLTQQQLIMDLMYLDGRPPLISGPYRWNRTTTHYYHRPSDQPPRFAPFRVRGADRSAPMAISPNQQILHRALRSCRRRILFV